MRGIRNELCVTKTQEKNNAAPMDNLERSFGARERERATKVRDDAVTRHRGWIGLDKRPRPTRAYL